jgi:addiction module HigA family antidote
MAIQHHPPHPGAILREDVLPALGLSVTEAARQLGVARVTLSRLINEQAGISPEMALKIEAWLGTENGGRAESWAAMQLDYDMWKARQKPHAA